MSLKAILLPPGVFILGLLAALAASFYRPRAGRLAALILAVALYVFSTPIFVSALYWPLERTPPLDPARIASGEIAAEAIVVLSGNKARADGEYDEAEYDSGALTRSRLRYAAHLYRLSGAPILATGGGAGAKEPSVAEVMAHSLARDYGVEARWLETRARNTFENAAYSREILAQEGITRIFLVTHAWHMPRAAYVFERQGFDVIAAPTAYVRARGRRFHLHASDVIPSPAALAMAYYAVHEYLGGAWYRLRF